MKRSLVGITLAIIALAAVVTGPVQADPLPGEILKFYQTPLDNGLILLPPQAVIPPGSVPAPWPGHDEVSTAYLTNGNQYVGQYMADDFCDLQSTPIYHVMWWGSYMGDVAGGGGGVKQFLITFESDVSATNQLGYSHPGTNIVSQIVSLGPLAPISGTFTETPEPIPAGPPNPDGNLFQYNAELSIPVPEQANQVEWIKIVALVDKNRDGNIVWGWHDRDYGVMDPLACTAPAVVPGEFNLHPTGSPVWHFQDDAVTGPIQVLTAPVGPPTVLESAWFPTFYIPPYDGTNTSKDLAFALYTKTACPDTSTNNAPSKWLEPPNLVNGITVRDTAPKILGDDFQCTLTGPISDIHIWGAWLSDLVGIVTNFNISFYSDIPATVDTFSRPGIQLWTTNFNLTQYTVQLYTNAPEQFYDPNTGQIVGSDSLLFRYNFCVDPSSAFVQTNGVIYWLVVQAYTVNGTFGWKSSTTQCHDDGVWGDTPGPIWNDLIYPPPHPLQGQSFDLAFELTTPVSFTQWQLQYFGCTICPQAAASADPDGDGMSNTNEFLAGTVPTNSASALRFTSIVRQGSSTNDINLTWITEGGHSYVVQTNSPPASGNYTNNFSDLSPLIVVPGSGESTTNYIDVGGATNRPTRYYRIRLGPPVCQ